MLLFVVDDHPLMREAIVMLFRRIAPTARIVEMGSIAAVALKVKEHGTPDIFCLDLKLPDTIDVSGVRKIRTAYPQTPIVVLSASPASDCEALCLEAGADLYVEKSAGATQLTQTFNALLSSEHDFAPQPTLTEKLSRRQIEMLQQLDRGLSNKEIADTLHISEHTVKVHLWRLFRRLEVKSRNQATHWARAQGYL